jgi:hypothetical protein
MNLYNDEIMNALNDMSFTVDFNKSHQADLEMMTENNWKQEKKKRGKRTREMIKEHTAMGLGSEIAVLSLPWFGQVSEIVENAMELNYVDRMRDYKYLLEEGRYGQQKTMNLKYPDDRWYISFSQLESLLRSAPFNQDLLIVGYHKIGELVFEYKPKFLIDMQKVIAQDSKYITIDRNSKFGSYIFDWRKAVADGVCFRFTNIPSRVTI